MPTKPEPFSATTVALKSCSLKLTLTEAEAKYISQFLALMDPWLTLGFSADALRNYLYRDDPALKRFGLFNGGVPIGMLCIRYPWLRGPYIELLGIETNHQGRGIARDIMVWIEQQTTTHAKNIWIAASSFNARALSAYERLGFKEVAVLQDLISSGKSEVFMRKRL